MQTRKAQISLRSVISAFVVRCLDSIRPLLATVKISSIQLVSAGRFESDLVANPEDRFSRDEAHLKVIIAICSGVETVRIFMVHELQVTLIT